MAETITGFSTKEVVKTLIGSILQGDRTGAQRWTAELLCTEKGYPKLLSIYIFLGFRFFLSANYSWTSHAKQKIRLLEDRWRTSGANLKSFRNSTEVRSIVAEWTEIWCQQQQKASPKLPTKKELYTAVASLKTTLKTNPTPSLHQCVQTVWKAHYDSDDLRILSNELVWAIQYHQITRVLIYFSWLWDLDDERSTNSAVHLLKRGPAHLPDSNREHIAWFIFSLFQTYAGYYKTHRDAILEVLDLWKDSWLLSNKNQRKQTLASICVWLTEGTFMVSPLIKNSEQIRRIVGEHEAVYGIIKKEIEGIQEQKAEETVKTETVVDKFSMTKEQRERATLKKMDLADRKLAAIMGLDFDAEFDDT